MTYGKTFAESMEAILNTKTVAYSMSAGNWGDGKSVCLWRNSGTEHVKVARFQSDCAARLFAEEFNFPLSDRLKERLYGKQ